MTTPSSFEQLKQLVEQDDIIALSTQVPSLKVHADSKDINGRGLLHAATHAQAGNALAWLLDHKIGGVDVPDNHGETPLMRAAWLGYQPGVALLLEAGASLESRAVTGGTPLHFAYAGGTPAKAVVGVLLSAGADPAATDKSGSQPEQWAQQAVSREQGQALLEKSRTTRPRLSINRPKV